MNTHPLTVIMGQIERARNEMLLVQKILNDVRAQAGSSPDFREKRRWIPREEVGEDLDLSRRSQVSNLEASYILYEEATNRFEKGITQFRNTVS